MKRPVALGALALLATGLVVWLAAAPSASSAPDAPYDPLAAARASIGRTKNREASVPPPCYTATGGQSNPCWTCHTIGLAPNHQSDWTLQESYAFSDFALENRWANLFRDRRAEIARISDEEILDWVRADNYRPLQRALRASTDYPGFVPDLDFARGFDEDGFAKDGSGWRAIRFKPFPGAFWPTNGSTDDVFVRLPAQFRRDTHGRPSRETYEKNLAILEAAIARPDATLPRFYEGGASEVAVRRYVHPEGTEYLHTVRYLDPGVGSFVSRRMKEVRYSKKIREIDDWGLVRAYEAEHEEKDEGHLPVFPGSPLVGLRNDFGWQLQGFIEDAQGRLRLQTEEEHLFCMGCHSNLGVTVDQTFALARKVPGYSGWRPQDVRGIPDVPQAGHAEPEALEYLRRVGALDELRANQEAIGRFVRGGLVAEAWRAGQPDLSEIVLPSRRRALDLDKAYLALVRSQRFEEGRDAILAPPTNVHRRIENGSTELGQSGKVFQDGRLHLDWSW